MPRQNTRIKSKKAGKGAETEGLDLDVISNDQIQNGGSCEAAGKVNKMPKKRKSEGKKVLWLKTNYMKCKEGKEML